MGIVPETLACLISIFLNEFSIDICSSSKSNVSALSICCLYMSNGHCRPSLHTGWRSSPPHSILPLCVASIQTRSQFYNVLQIKHPVHQENSTCPGCLNPKSDPEPNISCWLSQWKYWASISAWRVVQCQPMCGPMSSSSRVCCVCGPTTNSCCAIKDCLKGNTKDSRAAPIRWPGNTWGRTLTFENGHRSINQVVNNFICHSQHNSSSWNVKFLGIKKTLIVINILCSARNRIHLWRKVV